jgi:hypothetical protein
MREKFEAFRLLQVEYLELIICTNEASALFLIETLYFVIIWLHKLSPRDPIEVVDVGELLDTP